MLELKNVTKSYTVGDVTTKALGDVTVSFRKNEFVAILGTSGSGKTTSLNIIGGLDRYDSGDLIINGKSTKMFKEREWDAYRNNTQTPSFARLLRMYRLLPSLSLLTALTVDRMTVSPPLILSTLLHGARLQSLLPVTSTRAAQSALPVLFR